MIHPNTELRPVHPDIGYGVFATTDIPRGTAVYVKDALEVQVRPDDSRLSDPAYREVIEKYSYIDADGTRVLSWDIAKYVNHCCHPNTISTGYGFEIAIADIGADEEITDDYGLFNMTEPMSLVCSKANCRGRTCAADFDSLVDQWDATVRAALGHFNEVEQPLLRFIDTPTRRALLRFLSTGRGYRSVARLKYEAALPAALPMNGNGRRRAACRAG